MNRRDAITKAAAMSGAVVLPRAIMTLEKDREPGVTVLTPQLLLSVYDPTFNPNAKPTFMRRGATRGFVALPEWLEVSRAHVSNGSDYQALAPRADFILRAKQLRVLLNGRPVRGAFEASSKGGWVRFLEMRQNEDGTTTPYSHRKIDPNGPGGAVTGIAFGVVGWLIDEKELVWPKPTPEHRSDHKIACVEWTEDESVTVTLTRDDDYGGTIAFNVPKESPLRDALLRIEEQDGIISVIRKDT
jgi:hypothetical protein